MRNNISLSLMHDIKTSPSGMVYLEKGYVSQVVKLNQFRDLKELVLGLSYPKAGHGKDECYGLVPTLIKSSRPADAQFNIYDPAYDAPAKYIRQGQWENGLVSFFYADIDNKLPSRKVSLEEVGNSLKNRFGWNFFTYTTFSHTEAVNKFRVFIETDRKMTRREAGQIAILLNKELFRGQADLSVYSPAAFIYAPPYKPPKANETASDLNGSPMNVDDLLTKAEALISAEPRRLLDFPNIDTKRDQKKLTKQLSKAALSPGADDMSVRPDICISNPNVFALDWIRIYQQSPSHWLAMRSILGRVWRMSDADLTYGEMEKLLHEIDAYENGYLATKYGKERIDQLLRFYFTIPASGANDNWQPILDREPLGLTIQVVEAECGAGKTFAEFRRMSEELGLYVYSVPKIADISERKKELRAMSGGTFDIYEVYGRPGDKSVPEKLSLLRRDLARAPKRPTVVFTTHAATLAYDWKAWGDFELTYDEMPEIFMTTALRASKHPDIIKKHIKTKTRLDGQCCRVHATAEGRRALKGRDFDDYDIVNEEILKDVSKRNVQTWIKKEEWGEAETREALNFFTLFTPKNLTHFRSVRILADEAMKSTTLRIWAEKWAATLRKADFNGRPRKFPTAGRVTIKYFSESQDASINFFLRNPDLLRDICAEIDSKNPSENVLWTMNAKLKAGVDMANHTFITPKAHGRNDLQHHTVVAWLAALKPSKTSADLLHGLCGMSFAEVVQWREYNAMYQFVMRCALRDYESNVPVTIYVFSKAQAEYLQSRLGGAVAWAGQKLARTHCALTAKRAPLTPAERRVILGWSDKIVATNVPDFDALPDSAHKRKVDPKTIPHINQSAAKKRLKASKEEALARSWSAPQSCQIIAFPQSRRINGLNASRPVRGRGRPFQR